MHILILGAGYAGLRVAIELERLVREDERPTQITLIDQHHYHQHIALLHLIATTAVHEQEATIPLDSILSDKQVQVRQGRVVQINPATSQVVLDDGSAIPYDRLVLALGTFTDHEALPGASTHTMSLRTFPEAIRLRDHIIACFGAASKTADHTARRVWLTTAIVGGGFIGCQFAGELADWVGELAQEFGLSRGDVRIALLESGPQLLKTFDPKAGRQAHSVLDRRLVSIYLNTRAERVEEQTLHIEGDRILRAGTIVWTAGLRAPDVMARAGLPTDTHGRVMVDRYLSVLGYPTIFAIGDCTHIPDPVYGGIVPSTASYAMRQGEYLARALVAELHEEAPAPYEPVRLGHVVSLGPGEGVGDPLGIHISGSIASLLKQGIEKWYLGTLE